MIGQIKGIMSFGPKAILQIETDSDAAQMVCESVQEDLCDITIKKHKESKKRSNDANRYLWELCGEIAKELAKDFKGTIPDTAVDVYRDAIRNAGAFEIDVIGNKFYQRIKESWELRGLGWQCIYIDADDATTTVMLCKGSSVYTTTEMSRLIDYVVAEAKNLGIETLSDRELSLLKEIWE